METSASCRHTVIRFDLQTQHASWVAGFKWKPQKENSPCIKLLTLRLVDFFFFYSQPGHNFCSDTLLLGYINTLFWHYDHHIQVISTARTGQLMPEPSRWLENTTNPRKTYTSLSNLCFTVTLLRACVSFLCININEKLKVNIVIFDQCLSFFLWVTLYFTACYFLCFFKKQLAALL